MDPLIVTAELDPPLQRDLDALRRRHFPPERLLVGAHLTLLHALPGERHEEVLDAVRAAAPAGPLDVEATGPMSLGHGVAIRVTAPGLVAVRDAVLGPFADVLTPQDQQPLRSHVTVQNKVAPDTARALLEQLRRDWRPRGGQVVALAVWHYRGGPWEPAGRVAL